MYLKLLIIILLINIVNCSSGDSSTHFQRCLEKCHITNCTTDGHNFASSAPLQPFYLKLLHWDCQDECKYNCMWRTTDAYLRRDWDVPQFYGKWPFVRILGIQEPASFIFSLLNLYFCVAGFLQFRKEIRKDAPLFWLWQMNYAIIMNTWVWSSIFHTRDFEFTEFMDYVCAFLLVLMTLYCAVQRIFYGMPRSLNIVISTFFVAFFSNHAIYLNSGRVDYGYNVKLCIIMVFLTVSSWFLWSFINRKRQPYLWRIALYFSLLSLFASLELYDFPPFLWTIDAHSLWHLGSAIIFPLYNRFIIDDCKYLRKMASLNQKNV